MAFPVGIVGVGNMGGGMAARLLDLGWPVRVRDVVSDKSAAFAQRGAQPCASAAQAAHGAPVLIVCVIDADQTREVLFSAGGACESLAPGQCVMLCPTIAPADVEDVAARLLQRGVQVIDAPMSGGPARAREGAMSLMVACADAVFQRHRELIDALSSKVFRVSERPGDGARTKLVNNLLAGINLAGAAEAMALAQRLGLDLRTMLGVIEQSSGQSWIGVDRMRRAIEGDWAPRAHTTLLRKDTALALQMAGSAGFVAPLGELAHQAFEDAVRAGFADLDDASLFRLMARKP